jgi:hypothetical protein
MYVCARLGMVKVRAERVRARVLRAHVCEARGCVVVAQVKSSVAEGTSKGYKEVPGDDAMCPSASAKARSH